MRVSKLLIATMATALTAALWPAPASADWLLTPFVGANFGGNANFGVFDDFDDEVERRVDFGATLGWMGGGIVGFEVDFGYSPNFFQDTVGDANFEFGDSNVTTLMANLLVGAPIGGQSGPGIRPYASGGLGLIRSQVSSGTSLFNDLTTNDFGMTVGGGVTGFFNDNVGIRGDIRYFRSLQDNEPDGELDLGLSDFDFWRGTVGVTFRW
jgi:opacity protein-like surface antigen